MEFTHEQLIELERRRFVAASPHTSEERQRVTWILGATPTDVQVPVVKIVDVDKVMFIWEYARCGGSLESSTWMALWETTGSLSYIEIEVPSYKFWEQLIKACPNIRK